MEKVLRGILRYRAYVRDSMVKDFIQVQDHPHPDALFFTCMDSRMIPSRFTQMDVGDMFIVRNAGNIIPHSDLIENSNSVSTEPAALDLACVKNNVQHIIVCGHSDCKAINTLYNASREENNKTCCSESPLVNWMMQNSGTVLKKFDLLTSAREAAEPTQVKLEFQAETPERKFWAYIDKDDKFSIQDKLSQINCLQQLQNIASYEFLQKKLQTGQLQLHALWFDIYTGNVYIFSRDRQRFVEIIYENYEFLSKGTLAKGEVWQGMGDHVNTTDSD